MTTRKATAKADPYGMTTKVQTTAKATARAPAKMRGFFPFDCAQGQNDKSLGRGYWMVRLTVAVWMVEPPVAVTVTA
jgi:hypothetical protein